VMGILLPVIIKTILRSSNGHVPHAKNAVYLPGGKTLYGISVQSDPMTTNPYKTFFLLANILFLVLCLTLWHFTKIHPVWIYLITISLITFLFYGYDKYQAKNKSQRIPEIVLHLLTLLGGTLGAFSGQILFRHKTKKWKFQLVFIMIVVVQAGGMVWILTYG
jgi:uncharacterized membrane protein YsdA (DUF1294 family)